MNEISKALLAMSIAPLPLVGSLASLNIFAGAEPIGYGPWIFAGAITVGGGVGAWLLERSWQKLVANRIVIDIKPNQVIVDGVIVNCAFSSLIRFFKSRDALSEMLKIIVNETMFKQGNSIALRKSAHIRIWPGSLQVSDIELESLREAVAAEFISPVFELIDQPLKVPHQDQVCTAPANR